MRSPLQQQVAASGVLLIIVTLATIRLLCAIVDDDNDNDNDGDNKRIPAMKKSASSTWLIHPTASYFIAPSSFGCGSQFLHSTSGR